MGPYLVVFMVLSKLKTSTELNKMASVEKGSTFTRNGLFVNFEPSSTDRRNVI